MKARRAAKIEMIQENLRSQIQSRYGIENINSISKLEGGYWNRVFKLETERGEFILRICNPRAKPENVVFQHKLMRFMNARIPEVPLPINEKDGATFFVHDNRVISLLSFMRGEMASRKNSEHQTSAAAMIAKTASRWA